MGKANFTTERVAAFKCREGRQQSIYWDAKTPGLGLRVTSNGAKSYIFETRLQGKTLRMTIGDARTWTVEGAQKEATKLKTQTDQGINPRDARAEEDARKEEQQAARLAKKTADAAKALRESVTLADAWPVYLEDRKVCGSKITFADRSTCCACGTSRSKNGCWNRQESTLRQ